MSAAIDTMLYVGETPWHGLGHRYETPPATPKEIVEGAELGWEVDSLEMKTELHEKVLNYNTIYRKDTNGILGVVNKANITLTQNADMFNAFGTIIGSEVITETAASIDGGRKVFGCFKISDGYKLLDDDVEHYFVVVNEHLKCDGKITIINTPIRVVCQNTLTAALSNNVAKIRIPISTDGEINANLARKILDSSGSALTTLSARAEKWATEKVSQSYINKLIEEMFPYIEVKEGETSTHDKANERVDLMRATFLTDCVGADNLANYRGTKYAILNGMLDFAQHYYLNVDKSYDLNYRMGTVLGSSDTTQPIGLTSKFMKMFDKIPV